MIKWEEFWEKICGSFCTANEARKCAENFAQFFAQTSAGVIKICRRNFALGKVRRKNEAKILSGKSGLFGPFQGLPGPLFRPIGTNGLIASWAKPPFAKSPFGFPRTH